jgi:hypothetical protein
MTISSWRFSLRYLLLASALIPIAIYWFALPTIYAQQFSAAVASGDYPTAERLCVDRAKPFPGTWKEHKTFEPRAFVKEPTWKDFWSGERQLFVAIAYGDGSGLASCGVECKATRRGIEIGMALP